jgi:hypothetical protein
MSIAKNITLSWVEGYVPDDPDNSRNTDTNIYCYEIYCEFEEMENSETLIFDELQYELVKKIIRK